MHLLCLPNTLSFKFHNILCALIRTPCRTRFSSTASTPFKPSGHVATPPRSQKRPRKPNRVTTRAAVTVAATKNWAVMAWTKMRQMPSWRVRKWCVWASAVSAVAWRCICHVCFCVREGGSAWVLHGRSKNIAYRTVLISPRYANSFDPLAVCWEQFK